MQATRRRPFIDDKFFPAYTRQRVDLGPVRIADAGQRDEQRFELFFPGPVDGCVAVPDCSRGFTADTACDSRRVVDIEFEFSKNTNRMGDTLHLYLDDFYLNGAGLDVLGQ